MSFAVSIHHVLEFWWGHHPPASGAGPSSDPGEPVLTCKSLVPQDVLTCQTCPAAAIPAGPSLPAVLSLSGSLFLKLVLRRCLQVEFPPPAPQAGPSSPGHIHHWPPELLSIQVQWCPCVLSVQVLRCQCVPSIRPPQSLRLKTWCHPPVPVLLVRPSVQCIYLYHYCIIWEDVHILF